MKPTKDIECALVDVLDRILDKGVILNADVIIHVAGIPLIGINLRAALAGIETMLDYGMMEAWDASIREWYAKEYADRKEAPLVSGEKVILKTYASYYYNEGIYNTWQPGFLYLTNKRLLLFRKEPAEILFETKIDRIKALTVNNDNRLGSEKKTLCLLLENDRVAKLYAENTDELKKELQNQAELWGLKLKEFDYLQYDEKIPEFLRDENIIQVEKVWYLCRASGIMQETWRKGKLYITNKRICWQYNSEDKPTLSIPIESVLDAVIAKQNSNAPLSNNLILTISYENGSANISAKEEKIKRLKTAVESAMPVVA